MTTAQTIVTLSIGQNPHASWPVVCIGMGGTKMADRSGFYFADGSAVIFLGGSRLPIEWLGPYRKQED